MISPIIILMGLKDVVDNVSAEHGTQLKDLGIVPMLEEVDNSGFIITLWYGDTPFFSISMLIEEEEFTVSIDSVLTVPSVKLGELFKAPLSSTQSNDVDFDKVKDSIGRSITTLIAYLTEFDLSYLLTAVQQDGEEHVASEDMKIASSAGVLNIRKGDILRIRNVDA